MTATSNTKRAIALGQARRVRLGVALGNTTPSSSQNPENRPFLSGGVDYLEVSCWVHFSEESWENLSAKADAYKAIAEGLANCGQPGQTGIPVGAEGMEEYACIISARGMGRKLRCRWKFSYQGITVGVMNRRVAGHQPNVRISIPSTVLMAQGHQAAWEMACEFVKDWGGEVYRTNVSRLDICADVTAIDAADAVKLYHARAYVSRAKLGSCYRHGHRETGFKLGSDIQFRLYEKVIETEGDDAKRRLMVERRWGGETPDNAIRAEFQIRGEKLKELFCKDNSVEEVFDSLPKIADYLTSRWLTITTKPLDHENNHQSRDKHKHVSPIWKHVRKAFEAWTGRNEDTFLPPVRRLISDAKALKSQTIGSALSAIAKTLPECFDVAEAGRVIQEWINEDRDRFAKVLQERRFRLLHQTGIGPPDLATVPF